ncbi:MAG: acetyl-CoA carboxylase carboxyl transferase subunit alpha, partial [Puniceicoccales bacterium]
AHAARAAEALKITADKLIELGVVDDVVQEPLGGAHVDPAEAAANLKVSLEEHLGELLKLSETDLLNGRYDKFRAMGQFAEA